MTASIRDTTPAGAPLVLKNAHVIDPALGRDGIADVVIEGGKISSVGEAGGPPPDGAEVVDLAGLYLSPGWIDIHVHAYGTLGFADPDSIGIYQGVTSFVEAGGPGIGTLDEFVALLGGQTVTALYAGPYIRPMGIVGLNFIEDDARSIGDVPVARWMDWVDAHPGLLRYMKVGAFGKYGKGPLKLGKGLAEMLGLPLYIHIGEYEVQPGWPTTHETAIDVAEAGDIVTHIYHRNLGGVLGADGKVLPQLRAAERRGVLFDIGFGGYNYAWDIAEKSFGQGLVPHIISSDLQQFNVVGPVYSLANVMSIVMHLGLTVPETIAAVTSTPAKALKLDDRAGRLAPGLPADITVFQVENGAFELADCYRGKRTVAKAFRPVMAFKDGRRFDSDLARAQDERNWFMQLSEDSVPGRAARLSPAQLAFLATLATELRKMEWEVKPARRLDLDCATALQDAFHRARDRHALPLREALTAVYDSFLESPFTMQIGLFLARLERTFALSRLDQVARPRPLAA
ncbi:MAG: amidohydrolase family protein [Rhodospirillaceae bacterium]|nr:amidohydrolase family protein [Rhodospirillaceae bacterium]